jgi:hypothetical protein
MASLLENLKAAQRPAAVPVQLGGKTFHVRALGPIQRSVYLSLVLQAAAENTHVPAHVIVAQGLCNAEGIREEDQQAAVLAELVTMDGTELSAAAKTVLEISGLSVQAVRVAEKNSQPAGASVFVPAGVGTRKDRRAAASRARGVRRKQ